MGSFVGYGLLTLQSVEHLTEFRWTCTGCSDFEAVLHFVIFLLSRSISAVRRLSCIVTVFLYWISTHRIPCTNTCRIRAWYDSIFKPVACVEWWLSRWRKQGLHDWECVMYSVLWIVTMECYPSTMPEITEVLELASHVLPRPSLQRWPYILFNFSYNS